MTAEAEVLKQDARGRVRVPVERREALLEEFEGSGMSGAQFARLAGIKYVTFASWVQKRRRQRAALTAAESGPSGDPVIGGGSIRFVEAALVEGSRRELHSRVVSGQGLLIELPGGSRMRVESPIQVDMAAELLSRIAQCARTARC